MKSKRKSNLQALKQKLLEFDKPKEQDEPAEKNSNTPKVIEPITKIKRGRGAPKKPLIDTSKLLTN